MKHSSARGRIVAVLAAVVVVALAGCSAPVSKSDSGSKKLTPVTFLLNYGPGGSQFGFTYAKQLGLYKKAGLDVEIKPGTGSIATAQQIAAGKDDIGYADPQAAFSVATSGGDIKVVAPIQQVTSFAVVWLKSSGFSTVKDLVGKKIGLQPGTGNARLFQAVLAKNGVKYSAIKPVNIATSALVAALRGKQVDAVITAANTFVPLLQVAGTDIGYQKFSDAGVATVGQSLISNSSFLTAHPDVMKKFTEASFQGWAEAKKHPAAAAASMIKQFPVAGTQQQMEAELAQDITLLCAGGAKRMGPVPNSDWTRTANLLKSTGLLPKTAKMSVLVAQKYAGTKFPSC